MNTRSKEMNFCENDKICISLVEYLAAQMGCTYISDLCFLNSVDRTRLGHVVKKLSPTNFTLKEWNDALEFITTEQAAENREAAYKSLFENLLNMNAK